MLISEIIDYSNTISDDIRRSGVVFYSHPEIKIVFVISLPLLKVKIIVYLKYE